MERREREGAAAIRNPGVCLIKSNPLPAYRLASLPGRITLPPLLTPFAREESACLRASVRLPRASSFRAPDEINARGGVRRN